MMSHTLSYYYIDHSSLLLWSICSLLLQHREILLLPSTEHLFHHSISSYDITIAYPVITTLSTRLHCFCTIYFVFNLTDSIHFQLYFSLPFLHWSHCTFVIRLDGFVTFWIPNCHSQSPKWFFKIAYVKVQSLCCKILWVLTNV